MLHLSFRVLGELLPPPTSLLDWCTTQVPSCLVMRVAWLSSPLAPVLHLKHSTHCMPCIVVLLVVFLLLHQIVFFAGCKFCVWQERQIFLPSSDGDRSDRLRIVAAMTLEGSREPSYCRLGSKNCTVGCLIFYNGH